MHFIELFQILTVSSRARRGEMIALKWTEADTEARDIDDPSETYTENGAMAYAVTDDKVKLYYEETGSGVPVIFVHEFAGDHRSWEPQVRHFGKRYRAITFAARGFAPSDVPADASSYSQVRAADDIASVLDHLAIPAAHIVGLSMGGFATLHFGFRHPKRAKSLCVGGCGYGAEPDQQAKFKDEADVVAAAIQAEGMNAFAERYACGPTRVQFENKDPRGFLEFKQMLAGHNGLGSANTQRGVQRERPSLYTLIDEMKSMTVPTLILTGDEDWPCLLPGILMKQNIPSAALAVMPNSGHMINLEEPDEFNRIVSSFITQVDCGRWPLRDPRAIKKSITGMKD
jgi:pimeloyl-ACP methyl ester carboxylesterase